MWPDYCLGARYIIDDRYDGYVLERCDDFDMPYYGVLLMTDNPVWALDLIRFFTSDKWFAVKKLVDIIRSDTAWLRGTHAGKNRFIARLRKFMELLKEIHINIHTHIVPLYVLLGVEGLTDYVRVLNAFKGHYHRVRNKVHELVYPHLIDELLRIKRVELWFSHKNWYYRKVAIDFDFERYVIYLKIGSRSKHITLSEARTILKKIVNRADRDLHRRILTRDTHLQLELLEPIPKVIEP